MWYDKYKTIKKPGLLENCWRTVWGFPHRSADSSRKFILCYRRERDNL